MSGRMIGPRDAGSGRALAGTGRQGIERANRRALEGVRVLVVDARADERGVYTLVLALHGAEVIAIESVCQAREALAREKPNGSSELGLHGEDGYALIRQFRARGVVEGGEIAAAAVTASAYCKDRRRACAAGLHAFRAKPHDPDALIALVASPAGRGVGSRQMTVSHPRGREVRDDSFKAHTGGEVAVEVRAEVDRGVTVYARAECHVVRLSRPRHDVEGDEKGVGTGQAPTGRRYAGRLRALCTVPNPARA